MNIEINVCKNCQKEFESEKRFHKKFCCHKCAMTFNNKLKIGCNLSEENKNKISLTMKRKWENGEIKKEQLNNWIASGQAASSKKMKNKKFEEIYGKEKALKMRKHYSKSRMKENNPFYGKHHSVETKEKIIKNRKPEGYIYPSGLFNNVLWQSSYELAYLIYCYENNISIKRYDLEPIEYEYQNNKHHYYPDFIINNKTVVECKGYKDGKHSFKIKAVGLKHEFILADKNYINNLGFIIPDMPKHWILEQQQKYKDLIKISYFPWSEE